jgi:uncharacterized protein (TIGR03118 family)
MAKTKVLLIAMLAGVFTPFAHAVPELPTQQYRTVNLVATSESYGAQITDPSIVNAWGIAIRPAGLGGHFWVTANGNGTSNQFVGDVGNTALYKDGLAYVTTPGPNGLNGTPTGVVFNPTTSFKITQSAPNGVIANTPAKFLFATDNGVISAWTERANPRSAEGFDWPLTAITVIDSSARGSQYFGIGLSKTGSLFAADFGVNPAVRVFDNQFIETAQLAYPFATGTGQNPGDWVPFNVQVLEHQGRESVWVTYAQSKPDETDPSKIYAGEEDAGPGKGRLAEFSTSGQLLRVCDGGGLLNAPWGLAIASGSWAGAGSDSLLVSNFGDGSIARLDLASCAANDFLRDGQGDVIAIEGIWGLQFGNGASLGQADRLYFAAGPEDETAGLFGYVTQSQATSQVPLPGTLGLFALGLLGFFRSKRRTGFKE